MRQALISSQLAISLVLLAGAGLLLISLWQLQNAPIGFSGQRVVTASFALPAYRYGRDLQRTGWSTQQFNFYNELEARLKEVPGAIATAITDSLPPGTPPRTVPYLAVANPHGNETDPGMSGSVKWRYVTPGYFETLGIPIRRGRSFSDGDRAVGLHNVIVNESLARRILGAGDPIGKRLGRNTVIGVAADVRNAGATPTEVARLVASDGVRLTAVGAIVGIAASAGLLRLLKGLLYEVSILDVRVFAGAIAVLVAVAILAAWLPAHRASKIDPMVALRHD
jgi:hypothetical protein